MTARMKSIACAAVVIGAAGMQASPARATATYSPLDEYMLQSSIHGDRFEIAGGRLAAARAATPAVRSLGRRLVRDHAKSLGEAVTVARRLGIRVPTTPSTTQEWELRTVRSMSGLPFDAAYAYLEVQDHKLDIEDTKTELSQGLNPSIRSLARTDLPVLRTHLKLSKRALFAIPGTWPPE
jgi:putative membrane protein